MSVVFSATFLPFMSLMVVFTLEVTVSKEHAVCHVVCDAVESSHVLGACLALVYHHLGVGHRSLKHQFYMMVCPFLWQLELIFVHTFLVGDAVGECLAVELHAILEITESLQFPT